MVYNNSITLHISLMYIINSNDPKLEPWDTPLLIMESQIACYCMLNNFEPKVCIRRQFIVKVS